MKKINNQKINVLAISLLGVVLCASPVSKVHAMNVDWGKVFTAVNQAQGGMTDAQAFALSGLISSLSGSSAQQNATTTAMPTKDGATSSRTYNMGAYPNPSMQNSAQMKGTSTNQNMNSGVVGPRVMDDMAPREMNMPTDVTTSTKPTTQNLSKEDMAILEFAKGYVSTLQQKLIDAGYMQGVPTGLFDEGTQKALQAFQNDNGLKVSPVSGTRTLTILSEVSKIKNPSTPKKPTSLPPPISGNMKNTQSSLSVPVNVNETLVAQTQEGNTAVLAPAKSGDKGQNVLNIQNTLVSQGLLDAKMVSGVFDKNTQYAISNLQQKNGLKAVGSVGPQTTKLLNDIMMRNPQANMMQNQTMQDSQMNFSSGAPGM